jgi:isoamylase
MLGEFAQRLTGSPDLYQDNNRRPTASINLITAHDGFTLLDLVSYNDKHNDANGEDNNDGESNNRSWNCGAEGATQDEEILKLRRKQQRNLLTTMFLSQGVPMLVAGDEFGRTQGGNNNAYCQDNDISWLNWDDMDDKLLKFTQQLIALRTAHPAFRRRRWFQGQPIKGKGLEDIAWFLPDGVEMSDENWNLDFAKSLGIFINGKGLHYVSPIGENITDDNFYMIFNAHHESLDYQIPEKIRGKSWTKVLDTSDDIIGDANINDKEIISVNARSIVLLQQPTKND